MIERIDTLMKLYELWVAIEKFVNEQAAKFSPKEKINIAAMLSLVLTILSIIPIGVLKTLTEPIPVQNVLIFYQTIFMSLLLCTCVLGGKMVTWVDRGKDL